MSLIESPSDDETVITITLNPKSKWPVWLQILSNLCYRPLHDGSQDMKEKLNNIQAAFRIVQIVVAVMNLALGCLGFAFFFIASCWLRGMVTYRGLDTASIIMGVFQFCVAIAFCIMTLKSLCKRSGGAKSVEHTASEAAPGEDLQQPSELTFCFQRVPLILSRIKSPIVRENTNEDISKNVGDQKPLVPIDSHCMGMKPFILSLIKNFSVCENTKEDISKNVSDQKPLIPIDSHCMGVKPFILSLIKNLSVCEDMKGTFTGTHTALGVVQIITGVVNIALLSVGLTSYKWFGAVFLVAGIVCVLAVKYPSLFLLIITDILNIIGAALSITAVVQLSMELAVMNTSSYYEDCYPHFGMIAQEERDSIGACIYYKNLSKDLRGGIYILMSVLAALQFCVALSFCALTMKVLCNKDASAKFVPEPHDQMPPIHAEKTITVV